MIRAPIASRSKGMILLLRILILLTIAPSMGAGVLLATQPGLATAALFWLGVGTMSWLSWQLGKSGG